MKLEEYINPLNKQNFDLVKMKKIYNQCNISIAVVLLRSSSSFPVSLQVGHIVKKFKYKCTDIYFITFTRGFGQHLSGLACIHLFGIFTFLS